MRLRRLVAARDDSQARRHRSPDLRFSHGSRVNGHQTTVLDSPAHRLGRLVQTDQDVGVEVRVVTQNSRVANRVDRAYQAPRASVGRPNCDPSRTSLPARAPIPRWNRSLHHDCDRIEPRSVPKNRDRLGYVSRSWIPRESSLVHVARRCRLKGRHRRCQSIRNISKRGGGGRFGRLHIHTFRLFKPGVHF